ncbi:hypothetical protein AAC387_Pa06g2307 [Persea americana]
MAPKRQPSPPKHLSPPPSSSSSSGYEDEEEEEEEVQNNSTRISTPTSSQPPKKPTSKKPTSDLNQTPNPNSSTEEEDDDDEEEEEEEDSEAEKAKKIQPKPTQIKKKEEEEDESDDSGSDSGSDSDLPPSKVKPIKPITSKPMDSTPKPRKEAAAKPSTQKRPSASEVDSKKRKKPDAGEEEEETGAKKQLFQRIWTPEDELSILKAIIEFSKKGSDVTSDMNGFHQFVKKLLNVDMTKTQVSEKVRRMKKKYLNTAEKARKGKEPSFPKDHDKLMYELSKQIWGVDVETENNVDRRSGGNAKRNKRTVDEKVEPKSPPPSKYSPAKENPSAPESIDLMQKNHSPLNGEVGNTVDLNLYPYLNESLRSNGILGASALTEMDVKRALELMGHSQLKEWEERCIKMRSKERDVFMERTTLVYELAKQCYDLVKSSEE